ncbi:hypothetical protein [Paenibacillus terrigena]|uniref:hypothetical protein n=1 Tax=Paenibacillus terrigena TaxID=369333 RepID=UPI0003616384|nr:hypothetical protein [Paenibacillus terrigena]
MNLRKSIPLIILITFSLFTLAFSVPSNYQLTNTSKGLRIEVKDRGYRVQGTYLPPGKGNWVTYWLFKDNFEEDLFFFNTLTKTAKRIAISRDIEGGVDNFSAEFIKPIGFLTEDDFIYTSARVVSNKAIYSIKSIHIPSGKETMLFDNVLKNIRFGRGPIWLNKNKDILMVASNMGEIVHYDLKKLTSFVIKKKFPAEWPYDAISISNTGNYFEAWTIYDLNGNVVNKIHNHNPNVTVPQDIFKRFDFGLEDKYITRSYTFDGSEEHALDPYTAVFDWSFASQAIDIEKISGELVRRIQTKPTSNQYVEIYSWLSPDQIVLHYFKLKHYENSDPDVIGSYYEKYDIVSGKSENISVPQQKEYNYEKFSLRNQWVIEINQNFVQDKSGKVIKDNAIIQYTKFPPKDVR